MHFNREIHENDLKLSVLKTFHVNTPGYVLSECKLSGEYSQYTESVQSVLKGQQPNLLIAICHLIVNEKTKEREEINSLLLTGSL